MNIQAIVHKAEEGGYWAEVPSIPGCATQGETIEELRFNLIEAIEGCLSAPVDIPVLQAGDQVIGQGILPNPGGQWVVTSADQRQPPHLRQRGKQGPPFGTGT